MFQGKLYPSSKDGSRNTVNAKKDFLNPFQREELKKRLIEKYTKLYALNNPQMVKEEVENFFRQNNEINSSNLLTLEQRIKSQSLRGRSLAQPPHRTDASRKLELEGNARPGDTAYNYRTGPAEGGFFQSEVPPGGQPIGHASLDPSKLSQLQDIEYANEEEEWGTVYKYNHYLYKQEEKLKKAREQQKKQATMKQLDEQLKEKERREQVEKEKEQSYVNAQKKALDIENRKEEAKQQLIKEKTKFEKEMRDMQMKDISERRNFENQQDKALDKYLLQKIKDEMKKEQEEAADSKLKKKNELRRVMDENEVRKKLLAEQAEKERLQEIELQKKAIQIEQTLEEARNAEFKAKADRISSILKKYASLTQLRREGQRHQAQEPRDGHEEPALPRPARKSPQRKRASRAGRSQDAQDAAEELPGQTGRPEEGQGGR